MKKYWDALSDPGRAALLKKGQDQTGKAIAEKTKEPAVHKNDLVRLIHLFKDPDSAMLWTNAFGTWSRRQLDARHSDTPNADGSGTLADETNPWPALAARFNDYDDFIPQNVMVQYKSSSSSTSSRPEKVSPWKAASSDFTVLATHCYDLEPTVKQLKLCFPFLLYLQYCLYLLYLSLSLFPPIVPSSSPPLHPPSSSLFRI